MVCLVLGSRWHWTTQYLLRTHVGRCLSECYCSVALMVHCVLVHRSFWQVIVPIFLQKLIYSLIFQTQTRYLVRTILTSFKVVVQASP